MTQSFSNVLKQTSVAIVVFILFLYAGISAARDSFPLSRGAINDFASVIPADIKVVMESLAEELLQKTGTAVVVATVETVGDTDPDTYANKLYEYWGIGRKGEDKGVLIFLAVRERKIRIETGYGVEGILPDGRVGRILDESVAPFLRQNDYGKGLLNGMLAIGRVIAKDAGVSLGEGYAPVKAGNRRGIKKGSGLLPVIFFLVVFFLFSRKKGGILPFLILLGMSGRGGRYGGGFGGGGGFSGGFGGFGGGSSGGGGASRGF